MMKRLGVFTALVGLAVVSFAQQDRQPRGKAEATINGKQVVIDYGRPALKGRTVDELMNNLPEDRVWRAGENQVTTLKTETPIELGGEEIPAGTYSLYVHIPEGGEWSLLVNEDLGIELGELWAEAPANMAKEPWPRLDGYAANIADDEVARIPLTKKSGSGSQEVFTIALSPTELTLSWGDQTWSAPIQQAS